MLDVLPKERIIAFTNGQVGNKDFDTARIFTQNVLDKHYFTQTGDANYKADNFVQGYVKRPKNLPLPISWLKSEVNNPIKNLSNLPLFNGFFGDAISGKRLNGKYSKSFDDAKKIFC